VFGKKSFSDGISATSAFINDALVGDLTARSSYDTFAGLMVGASHSTKDPARDGVKFVRIGGTDTDPLKDQGSFVKQVGVVPSKNIKVAVFG